jgi:hypothetical protein
MFQDPEPEEPISSSDRAGEREYITNNPERRSLPQQPKQSLPQQPKQSLPQQPKQSLPQQPKQSFQDNSINSINPLNSQQKPRLSGNDYTYIRQRDPGYMV